MAPSHRATPDVAYFDHDHVTVIAPGTSSLASELRELWAYRELLVAMVDRDVRVRYKQTWLGAGWALLRPLLTMAIFTVVFGRLAKLPSDGAPYSVFVLAALLPWTFFSTAAAAAAESLVGSQGLISKIYFPRLIVPLAPLGVALVDLVIGLLVLCGLAAFHGSAGPSALVLVPVGSVLLLLATIGVGTGLAALAVEFRDVRHLLPFLLQTWLYVTPVVYPASMFPERWRWALYLNPVAGPVEAFRAGFVGRPPDVAGIATSALVAGLIFTGSLTYFRHVERRFADIV
jgi:lipopolysaccharide transport system permease protein